MQSFKFRISFLILILVSSFACAQKIEWFKNSSTSAIPYGGEKELKEFVKTEMVYPKIAKEEEIEGNVFISYQISSEGKVIERKPDSSSSSLLVAEAIRIFDKIIWEANPTHVENVFENDLIKFEFDLKAYNRLVKKRGYDVHPKLSTKVSQKIAVFTINQLDEKPSIANAASINQFIAANFKYPSIALQREISGRVSVEFIIEPYGLVTNVRVVEGIAGGCSEETIRLVKEMRWNPGIKNGEAVRTIYTYQLNFVHPGGTMR